jgi:hypothetical protein
MGAIIIGDKPGRGVRGANAGFWTIGEKLTGCRRNTTTKSKSSTMEGRTVA